ncbi:BRO-N domain-containing protein [Avibacterium paragallinarum]|uniref:BRO-N domain-containing protein n=2 Tax=Avibacterium paragallinarum TaxID=728 RepID=UPI001F5DB490|nr:Bro-N domain-containing protein [Avibacterium paragallinarum]
MTTLTFQNTTLSVIDQNNQKWIPALEVGRALKYKNPLSDISKLYERNKDEFTPSMTALIEMDTASGIQKVRIFSLRGCWLLGMRSHTKVAKEFRKWVLDILDQEVEQQKPKQLALPEPENNELLQLLMRIYCYGLQYSDYQRAVLGTSLNDEVGKGKLIGDFCTEGEPAQQGYLFVFTPNIEKDLQQAREIINRHVKAQHKKRTEF